MKDFGICEAAQKKIYCLRDAKKALKQYEKLKCFYHCAYCGKYHTTTMINKVYKTKQIDNKSKTMEELIYSRLQFLLYKNIKK